MVGFNFAPRGWAFCDGQILPINQNQALFSLLGTTYGGDGRVSFGLPDMRGRTPIHVGSGYFQGYKSGEENHTLTLNEIPAHSHELKASSETGDTLQPNGAVLARNEALAFAEPADLVAMGPSALNSIGANQPHTNMQPYLALNYCIALQGLFPSQN
ncbi:MAG: phage tail protein [Myxococcales bacterium]|nr:phage tail protein [Myxococcales bacterium]